MGKVLLSIDWDYFIPIKSEWCGSYLENKKSITNLWYKRYLKSKMQGIDIQKYMYVDKGAKSFWSTIKKIFGISKNVKLYISDSHKLSYYIAKEYKCDKVYSFDAHSDLGYGGLKSLEFELNCANWLGKLLKGKIIKEANIVYSKYSRETPKEFCEINNKFDVNYYNKKEIMSCSNIPLKDVQAVHICRSGAWTPPWLDDKFSKFVHNCNMNYKVIDCPVRKWNIKKLNLSQQLDYLYS
ncbi:arginase [Haloimpatiens sp. FM7330]|uniref:arginase n=1 Tax=Haloimpatiens sp. FM7330 TaxID=3298610 RepID=UPI00362DE508